MRHLARDVRFGLRLIQRDPGFTAVAVLTLALGIAVNTTVFSWIDALLLRPFPGAADPHQLAVFEMVTTDAPNGANMVSYPDYRDYRANLKSLSGLAVHHEDVFSLGEPGSAEARWGEMVSANYFDVLRVTPALGRTFTRQEDSDELGAHPVAVISHRLWKKRFRSSPDAIGSTLRVNQRELTIVGVAPPEFRGTMPGLAFDIWIPSAMAPALNVLDEPAIRSRGNRSWYAVARVKSGVDLREARAEAAAFSRSLQQAYPNTNTGVSAAVLPVWQFHSAAPDLLLKPLRILMAVAIVLLLIVCANVANLLLARSVARRREMGVRLAMGAGGLDLSRQLLTETLILAGAGAVIGIAATPWMADMLAPLVPDINAPVAMGFTMNLRILAFTTLICVASALLAGMIPAIACLRASVNEWLADGGRGGSEGLHSRHTRDMLVVSEVALACLALIGAGVFVRSFQEASRINPGFDSRNVVLARMYMNTTGFDTPALQQFSTRLRNRIEALPSVENVSYADYAPLGSSAGPYERIDVDGHVPTRDESMNINRYFVAPGFFRTLRIPLLEGRDFRESDRPETPRVVIVNETFVRRYFHGGSALGRQVRFGKRLATVIGVAKDGKYFDVGEAPRAHFFCSYQQRARAGQQLYFFVRSSAQSKALMAAVRSEAAAVDPKAGALDVMPMREWTGVTLLPQKVTASMAAALGLISLVLAAVGLYSVMAYAVSQRTREIGIRMALGARPRNVVTGILLRGLGVTAVGLGAGMAAALVTMRLVSTMLVNVSATDPLAFAGAAAFLLVTGVVACYLPARRASKVDPMTALRCE